MTFGGKTSIVKQVKQAFNADKSKHRVTRTILAATKHNSKTIEKLNKLLLKKTKKLERYRAAKRLRPSSDSRSRSRSSRSRSSDSSSTGELAVIMALQDKINKNMAATNAYPAHPLPLPDPYGLHDYNMDPMLPTDHREEELANLIRRMELTTGTRTTEYADLLRQLQVERARNRAPPVRGYGKTYGNKNVHIYFDVKRKYHTYGAVRLSATQRAQVSDYINSFAQYLVEKGLVYRVVSSASNYNTYDFKIHVNMDDVNKTKVKTHLGYFRRSSHYHPSLLDTYDVEVTSVS